MMETMHLVGLLNNRACTLILRVFYFQLRFSRHCLPTHNRYECLASQDLSQSRWENYPKYVRAPKTYPFTPILHEFDTLFTLRT